MNDQIFKLVMALLEHEPPSRDRTEIIKFFLLPRNTSARPIIEMPDEEVAESLGPVERPDAQKLYNKAHPIENAEKEAIKKTLGGVVDEKNK